MALEIPTKVATDALALRIEMVMSGLKAVCDVVGEPSATYKGTHTERLDHLACGFDDLMKTVKMLIESPVLPDGVHQAFALLIARNEEQDKQIRELQARVYGVDV